MTDLALVVGIVIVVAIAGMALGMLVAPRLARLIDTDDEEIRDDGPG
jgi:urea transporter